MEKEHQRFTQFYKTINLVYMANIFGLLFFMTIVYFNTNNSFFSFSKEPISLYIGLAVAIIALFASKFLYEKALQKVENNTDFSQKLSIFSRAFLLKISVLETAGFINTVQYLITSNKIFLIFAAISILGMLLAKPTPEMLIKDLHLSSKEQEYINHSDNKIE